MSAIPVVPDDDQVQRQRGIPLAQDPDVSPIAIPRGAMPPLAIGKPPLPLATSNRGIGVTPQTPSHAIPLDPSTGQPEALNNKGIPIKAGIAGLWAKVDNIQNPVLRVLGKIGTGALKAIDTAGRIALPGAESRIPGSQGYENVQAAKRTAATNNQAKLENEQAQTANIKSETDARENPQPKVGVTGEEQALHDLMTGENGQPRVNPETGKPYSYLEAYGAVKQAAQDTKPDGKPVFQQTDQGLVAIDPKTSKAAPVTLNGQPLKSKSPGNDFEQFYADYIKDNNIHDSAHNRLMARKAYAAAGQAPQHDQRQLAVGPDGTVIELRPGMKVPQGSKTMAGDLAGSKPSADEQKRADLVENLNENLDQLEDIVKRRSDLFGKVAGRTTKLKEMIGSNDPDVAALKGIEDRLGMVAQSSHGMRSAHHVEQSANSILNSYNNGPEAMLRAISDARKSGATFTQDVERKTGTRQESGPAWSAPSDAPSAPLEDGHQLKKNGQIIAVSKGGKWVKP